MSRHKIDIFLIKSLFKLFYRLDKKKGGVNLKDIHSILIVNTTAVGDTLMSTPSIRAIRKAYPHSRIVAMVSPAAKEVLLKNPNIDDFINHEGRVNVTHIIKSPYLLRRLRSENFDMAIVLHGNDPDIAPLTYISGAKIRMGWATSQLAFLFSHPVKTDLPDVHEIDIRLNNLNGLGIDADGRHMDLFISDSEENYVKQALIEKQIRCKTLIALHPFASKSFKAWPVAEAATLAKLLVNRLEKHVVILGGKREALLGDCLKTMVGGGVFNFAGLLNIRQSGALIKKCQLMITTDSGPLHMAQALGVPTIALIGPTNKARTGPINKNSIIIQGNSANHHKNSMKGIKGSLVFEKARDFLRNIESR